MRWLLLYTNQLSTPFQITLYICMQVQRLTILRLQKEQTSLESQPIQQALIVRHGTLDFHFCLINLEPPFSGGFYHGLLQLHQNYPFSPPKLIFYTPSGRFQCNVPICTSFTNFHEESWTSVWNVRSLVIATISFMYSNEPSLGCRNDSEELRRKMAEQSLQFNLRNQVFVRLFSEKLKAMPGAVEKVIEMQQTFRKQKYQKDQREVRTKQVQTFQEVGSKKQTKRLARCFFFSSIFLALICLVIYASVLI